MTVTACFDTQTLRSVMFGERTDDAMQALEAHLDGCDDCRVKLAQLIQVSASSSEAESENDAPASGELLDPGEHVGRYIVLDVLGAGAWSVVYAAYDPQLDRKVALKLVRADVLRRIGDAAGPSSSREAQSMARLSHPNVVAVHDVGLFRGSLFIAMELVANGNVEAWVRRSAPGWQAIVACFAAAGRGLEAAHAANLVHRDIKPANLLVGDDGKGRVSDFGLAMPTSGSSSSTGEAPLTFVGTPAFMAPEQLAGRPATAPSDQFSFCAALFEALYRKPAFAGVSIAELAWATEKSPLQPRQGDTPAWVFRVLRRGLQHDPARRYPSMGALLRALDPRRRSAWRLRGLLVAATLTVGVFVIAALSRGPVHSCAPAPERLSGVWDASLREQLGRVFARVPAGSSFFEATARNLDQISSKWVLAQQRICEGTWVRGDQSPLMLDARMACLDHQRRSMQALVATLLKADDEAVRHAPNATATLDAPEACETSTERPETESSALATLRTALAEAGALAATAQYSKARELAQAQVVAASALHDPLAAAEAELELGRILFFAAPPEEAEKVLYQGIFHAEQAGAAPLGSDLWGWVSALQVKNLQHTSEGRHSALMSQALSEKAGAPLRLEVGYRQTLTSALLNENRFAEAEVSAREVLVLREKLHGADNPAVLSAWDDLAVALGNQGKVEESVVALQRALALAEKGLGVDHPDTALILNNLGTSLQSLSREDEALALYTRAYSIFERTIGADRRAPGVVGIGLCTLFVQMNRPAEAMTWCHRAVDIALRLGRDPIAALALNALGVAQLANGDGAAAQKSFSEALRIDEATLGPTNVGCSLDLLGLGQVALQRRAGEAIPLFERAVRLREKGVAPAVQVASAQFWLARALWEARSDRARAETLLVQARKTLTEAGAQGAHDLRVLEQWLAHR